MMNAAVDNALTGNLSSDKNAIDVARMRKFGLTLALVFVGLFGTILPLWSGKQIPYWPWAVGFTLLGMAMVAPRSLNILYKPWMRIGHYLGWINTCIILSVVFYVIVTPIGFLMRIFGYDPIDRGYDKSLISYRKNCTKRLPRHMEAPF